MICRAGDTEGYSQVVLVGWALLTGLLAVERVTGIELA
jgi:hypothetical protein